MKALRVGLVLLAICGGAAFAISQVEPARLQFDVKSAIQAPSVEPSPTPAIISTFTATPRPTHTSSVAPSRTPTGAPTPPGTPDATAVVLVGAGDIAGCNSNGDEATAALLDNIGGTVITLGDNTYPLGSAAEFAQCYAPSWGRFKSRTRPAPGNHDYGTRGAAGYFNYFGPAAGDPKKGYYSYDLGAWHLIALNSNCYAVGGCSKGSPQELWLRDDLSRHQTVCTLAYWHHPRFSSGPHGSNTTYTAFWQALYEANGDVVLVGHDHDYERFTPQDPNGVADPVRGIREFVVGTGGFSLYPFIVPAPNSEVRDDSTFGVIKLTLHPTRYDWQFIPVAGKTFTDSGSATCH